jgi:NAD(P)-dependent dehydrogenase (short-subunit alcohol dehydrogenase family)
MKPLIGSTAGHMGVAGNSAYSATKAALRSYTRTWTREFNDRGIRFNTLSPGPIDTEIWDQPDNVPALMHIDKVPAADCAAGIADAIADDGFEYYVPPVYPGGIDAKAIAVGKHESCDQYLRGMADFANAMREQQEAR